MWDEVYGRAWTQWGKTHCIPEARGPFPRVLQSCEHQEEPKTWLEERARVPQREDKDAHASYAHAG